MKLIRFVSVRELDALLRDGEVKPLKPNRDVIYFFPNQTVGEEPFTQEHTIPYRLEYASGVVADIWVEHMRVFVCLNIEMDEKNLKLADATYADPDGCYFDTITVYEYHSTSGYRLKDVKSIDLWAKSDYVAETIKHFDDVKAALEWVWYLIGLSSGMATQNMS